MKKLLSLVCAATMAIAGSAPLAAPANAAPLMQRPVAGASDVTFVQGFRNDRIRLRRGFHRHGDHGWYNGHRGYRYHRPGYRRHGDFWFPAGAFIAGAVIGGALSSPGGYYEPAPRRVYRGYGNSHVQWCYNRYRSYRAYDNTFQPYNGPRQQCYSPYN